LLDLFNRLWITIILDNSTPPLYPPTVVVEHKSFTTDLYLFLDLWQAAHPTRRFPRLRAVFANNKDQYLQ